MAWHCFYIGDDQSPPGTELRLKRCRHGGLVSDQLKVEPDEPVEPHADLKMAAYMNNGTQQLGSGPL